VKTVGSRGMTVAYHVKRGENLLATAETEHIWVDAGSRRPTRFPEELKAPFESFLPPPRSH
jgi:acyl-CoA thioesterase FadM